MKKRPKIALTVSFNDDRQLCVNEDYLNAVYSSGGIGTVLPYTTDKTRLADYSSYFDGFMFCGGGDISPSYYSRSTKNICSLRDEFEKALFDEIYSKDKPILGICRGEQVINVFLGGTLHPHIDAHMQSESREVRTQEVVLREGGYLNLLLGEKRLCVNSFHHQAVKELGKGLVAEAFSSDGHLEAFSSLEHRFCIGVQWHPESFYENSATSSAIFDSFIKACR